MSRSVVITVADDTVKLWQTLVRAEKRIGEIDRNTKLNKRIAFRKFLQEYVELKLPHELLIRLETCRRANNATS